MPPWPRSTAFFLLIVGGLLALVSFVVVLAMPELPAISAESAAWTAPSALINGEPGIRLLSVLFAGDAGEPVPVAVLQLIQALVLSAPLIWLPLAVARVFRRARAGYALIVLPALTWFLNNGTILIGTQLGLLDEGSGSRVPATFGIPASLTFLTLSVGLLMAAYRLRTTKLVATLTVLLALTVVTGLFGWLNGVAVAVTLSAVTWRSMPNRRKVLSASIVTAIAAIITTLVHVLVAQNVTTHAPDPQNLLSGEAFQGLLLTLKQFGAMIVFIVVGFLIAFTRRVPQRRSITAALLIATPALVAGLTYSAVTTPVPYNQTLLIAALGYLSAVALGSLVWSITSLPSHVRATERSRLNGRRGVFAPPQSESVPGVSVVVPTRNGTGVLEETLDALGTEFSPGDEIIVVENGSTDGTTELLERVLAQWKHPARLVVRHSNPGLGEALRVGVLASRGDQLLLTADDLPFGFTDLAGFRHLPRSVRVAIGSKAHPESIVLRSPIRMIQSRIFRFLREALLQSRVGDSQGTLWVNGAWGRQFANLSRESGLMWTTELVLAAEQQQLEVHEVPVSLAERHETGSSRFKLGDAWRSVVGFTRLAVYKDDYCDEDWVPDTRPEEVPEG